MLQNARTYKNYYFNILCDPTHQVKLNNCGDRIIFIFEICDYNQTIFLRFLSISSSNKNSSKNSC